MTDDASSIRLDRWLWYARIFKSRTMASGVCADRRVRVNGAPVSKPSRAIRPGDVLTVPQGNRIRVLRVLALGERRGPAAAAAALYEDLSPPDAAPPAPVRKGPRPTKADRRALAALRSR